MKISLVSDLHLDFYDMSLPGGDVLIMAGDICEARELGKQNYNPEWFMKPGDNPGKRVDRFHRFMQEEVTKYRKVFYVAGNHEHYGGTFHKSLEFMRAAVPANVRVLEKEYEIFEGVMFIGATFWTDFNKGDGLTMYNAKDRMNDYNHVTVKDPLNGSYHKMDPKFVLRDHYQAREFFKFALEENRRRDNLPVVVITHHAPTAMSIPEWYKNDYLMNGCYYSDQSEFILDNPEIKYWVHGHTHTNFEYDVGTTRVMCNPRGYHGYEASAHTYDATRGFEIGVTDVDTQAPGIV